MSDPEKPARVFLDMALIARLHEASLTELLALLEAELRVFHELAEHSAEAIAIYRYQLRQVPAPGGSAPLFYQSDIVKSSVLAQRSELALDLQQRRIDVISMALHTQLRLVFYDTANTDSMMRKIRKPVVEEVTDLPIRWGNEPTP